MMMLSHFLLVIILGLPSGKPVQDDTPINADWKVAADSGPARPTWPATLPYKQLNNVHPRKVLYPAGLTTFLMTSYKRDNNDISDNVLVGDLLTGKSLGIVRNLAMPDRPTLCSNRITLSSDGKLLAHFHFPTRSVRVVEVKTGKVKHSFPFPVLDGIYLFTRPDQLIAIGTETAKEGVMVWDVATGKETARFPLRAALEQNAGMVSVSPGGRFLALPMNEDNKTNRIVFFDLMKGELAGEVWAGGRHSQRPAIIKAIAISPDGKEIAAVASYPDPVNIGNMNPCVTIWSLSTGRELSRVIIERGNRGQLALQGTEPLQWFPDQQAFLIDQRMVVNRSDGKLIEFIEAVGDVDAHFVTKVLDDRRLLVANHHEKAEIRIVKR